MKIKMKKPFQVKIEGGITETEHRIEVPASGILGIFNWFEKRRRKKQQEKIEQRKKIDELLRENFKDIDNV
jgi:hypothetical protein